MITTGCHLVELFLSIDGREMQPLRQAGTSVCQRVGSASGKVELRHADGQVAVGLAMSMITSLFAASCEHHISGRAFAAVGRLLTGRKLAGEFSG